MANGLNPVDVQTLFQSATITNYRTVTLADLTTLARMPALAQNALSQNHITQPNLRTLLGRLTVLNMTVNNRSRCTRFFDWLFGRTVKISLLKTFLPSAIAAIHNAANPPSPPPPPVPLPAPMPILGKNAAPPPNNNPLLGPQPPPNPEPIGIDEERRRTRKINQLLDLTDLASKEPKSRHQQNLLLFLEDRRGDILDPIHPRNPPLPMFTWPTDDLNRLQGIINVGAIGPAPGSCRFGALTLNQELPKGKHQMVVSMDTFAGQLAHTFDSNGPCIACNNEETALTSDYAACFVTDKPNRLDPNFMQTLQAKRIPTLDSEAFKLFQKVIAQAVKAGRIPGPKIVAPLEVLGQKAALLQRVRNVFNTITDQQLKTWFPHLTDGAVDTSKKVCRTIADARHFTTALFDVLEKSLRAGEDPAFPIWTHSSRHWEAIITSKKINNSTGGAGGPGVYFSDWDEEGHYGDTTFAVDEGVLSTTAASVFIGGATRARFAHETLHFPPTWIAVNHKAGGVFINERSVAYIAFNDMNGYASNTAHVQHIENTLIGAGLKIRVVSRTVSRIFQYCIHQQQEAISKKRLLPKGWAAYPGRANGNPAGSIPNHVAIDKT